LISGNTQALYVMRGHDQGSGGSSSERVSASVAPRMGSGGSSSERVSASVAPRMNEEAGA
jgi:hypothetical protein